MNRGFRIDLQIEAPHEFHPIEAERIAKGCQEADPEWKYKVVPAVINRAEVKKCHIEVFSEAGTLLGKL